MAKLIDIFETQRKSRFYLLVLYRLYGPKGDRGKPVPHTEYAAMSAKQVNNRWDFSERHLMHKVAKVLTEIDNLPVMRRAKLKQPK